MKSILTFILATFLLFPLQAQEKVYTVDNLPKVHLQNKMQYVCNPAGILSQAACDSIDSMYNPQIQISAESETKRSIFREKDKTKRSKKESAQHSKSRNKSFVMTSVSAL